MKLQVDIPENINIELKVYKMRNKYVTIGEVVNVILAEKFKLKYEAKKMIKKEKKIIKS